MTQLAASSSQNPSPEERPALLVDGLERRLRHAYPLKLFFEYILLYMLVVTIFVGIYLALQLSSETTGLLGLALIWCAWVAVASLYAWSLRNFWRLAGVAALLLGVLAGIALLQYGAKVAPHIKAVVETVQGESPVVAAMLVVVVVLAAASCLYLLWVLGRAGFALVLVNRAERSILADLPSRQSTTSNIFSRLWGFPPLYRFVRGSAVRYAIIIGLSLFCATLFSFATLLPVALADALAELMYINLRWCASRDAACFHRHAWLFLGSFTAPIEVIVVCLAAAWGAQRLLQRLLRFSLESLQEVDPRPPILFLRAFRDDQIPLRAPGLTLFGRILELGRRANSLDQVLLEEGTPFGPVVGLGNPDDKRPPYGAARGYFDHKSWQEAVADLAGNAILIVICIDDSDGIWWEVEHLAAHRHLHKTLFVLHPRYARASENAAILQRIAERGSIGTAPGEAASQSTIGFFQDRSGGTCVVRSSTFSRFAYLLTLRAFIRERLGLLPASLADRSRWPERL